MAAITAIESEENQLLISAASLFPGSSAFPPRSMTRLDRILISQAKAESATLVAGDATIRNCCLPTPR